MAKEQNQTLGLGELHFAPFKPGTTTPTGYRYFGDSSAVNLNVSSETSDYYSSERGTRVKTRSVTLQTEFQGSFGLTNIDLPNVAMFFLGEAGTVTQVANESVDETLTDVTPGRSYQLGESDATPIGARQVTINTIAIGATPLVAGTDYEIDEPRGIVTFLDGAPNVTDGSDVVLNYALAEVSYDRMISGSAQIEGALRFDAYNAAGENIDYRMAWVKISPNGDLPLKGEEWMNMSFNIEINKLGAREAIYANGQPYAPAA